MTVVRSLVAPFRSLPVKIVLFCIVERKRKQNLLLVFLLRIRHVLPRDLVRQGHVPIDGPYERIHLVSRISKGVKGADKASHTRSQHDVNRNLKGIQIMYYADVRGSLGSAAAQYEGHSWTFSPDAV